MAAFLSSPTALAASIALLAGVGLAEPAQAASQYVVISAEGSVAEAFPPGRVLVVGDTIDLPEGATLTLLGEDGSVATIPGPANVAVTEDDVVAANGASTEEIAARQEKNRSTLAKLASIISGEKRASDSLGVSRGFDSSGKVDGLEDPWVLPVHRSAAGCVRNEPIRIGREIDRATIPVIVKGETSGDVAELEWKAGENVLVLPDTIAPGSKEIVIKAGSRSVFIDLNLAPESVDLEDPMAVIGWMVDEGCDSQALAFARLLARDTQ